VPQRKDVFSQELRSAAWQTLPSTYVVCERDNAVPPALQEVMAGRAGTVSRIEPHRFEPLALPLAPG
jgi:hypothetical protein